MWFDSPYYPLLYAHRSEAEARQAVQTLVRHLQLEPGARILDVGCGRGRHLWPLLEQGYDVSGIDLAAHRINEAQTIASERGLSPKLYVGSMLDRLPNAPYDAVVNWFTSFGFFDDRETHRQAISHMAAALRPGGVLVVDFLNSPEVRANLVAEDVQELQGITFRQRRWLDQDFVHKTIEVTDGDRVEAFSERVMLLERADFEAFFAAVGLTKLSFLGDYDGSPWSPTSPRCIAVGRTLAP
ncbi:MAG: class I SAM-dependent methyltransferase [Schleiferiaceae bacterium]